MLEEGSGARYELSGSFYKKESENMTLEHACNVLHVDPGANDELINALICAIPDYIEVTTGLSKEDQSGEPLVDTVSNFILTLWYYSDHADDQALNRTISSLLKALSVKAREYAE